MTLGYIRRLYAYNEWPRQMFTEALQALDEEQLAAELEMTGEHP